MANAVGRLVGTLLSGFVYQAAGLFACLLVAGAMLLASALLSVWLPDTRARAAAT
jgi:predicted MFS family arabinose efflux permease